MQRSRRALRQRRALENAVSGRKHQLYKVSLSLVFVLWVLVFLLNLWISHGDGHGDGSGVESTWHETELRLNNKSYNEVEFSYLNAGSKEPDLSTLSTSSETELSSSESIVTEENDKYVPPTKHQIEVVPPGFPENDTPKGERLSRAAPLALDEFKSKAISPKERSTTGQAGIVHRLETGGAEYNYASASKGAKVLDFNKESKGASNILGKDKDKYLRNPCSAEDKFVVVELSEETLVDTIEIANFEHYSSNLKDFELLGSMTYPTDSWVFLGNFTANNVKQTQKFGLQDPQWVRYLKLNMLNHHGSEFYCTLSALGVYGVDAVERMLEDLISAQDKKLLSEEPTTEQTLKPTQPESTFGSESHQDLEMEFDSPIGEPEKPNAKSEAAKGNFGNVASEARPQQFGRMPGDTVLKILMQKVRSLDLNLAILERYLEELNSRYGKIFQEIDDEVAGLDVLMEKIKSDMKSFADNQDIIAKDVTDLMAWKSLVSLQMDNLARDNAILRSDVRRVVENQVHMENKGLAVFLVSFIFGCIAVTKVLIDIVCSVFRIRKIREFCGMRSSWIFLLLSCTIVVTILSL